MSEAKPNGVAALQANAEGAQEPVKTEQSPESVAAANARLLEESKKFKERAQKAEKALEEKTKAELAQEGKAKEEALFYKQKYENLYQASVKKAIESSVKAEAAKAGCIDLDAVFALGPKDALSYDEESLEVMGVDRFVEMVKSQKPYLFQKPSTPTINPTTPGGMVTKKQVTAFDVAKLPAHEKMKVWEKAMAKKLSTN